MMPWWYWVFWSGCSVILACVTDIELYFDVDITELQSKHPLYNDKLPGPYDQ